MNLIKCLCGVLALALVLGIFTSGGSDNANPEEPEPVSGPDYGKNEVTVNNNTQIERPESDTEKATGTAIPEEVGESGENKTFSPAISKNINPVIPKPPAPSLLENGTGEIAVRKRILESRIRTATGLIEENGEEVFSEFREEGASWFYGDFYIFVGSMDGKLVVYPPNGSKEGIDLKEFQDSDGKPIGELFLETALNEAGEGWVDYNWPVSGSSEPSRKYTFIKKVPGKEQTYFIGTGFYPEECIITRNLGECEARGREGNITVSELFNPENFDRKPDLECSITYSALKPGGNIASQLVETPRAHYILEGEGVLYLDDIPVDLRSGQFVYVPEGSFQTIYNTGNTDLLLLSVNQSAPVKVKEDNFESTNSS